MFGDDLPGGNELPQEVHDILDGVAELILEEDQEAEEARAARLQNLGVVIAKKRDEAIEARKNSGIEEDWTEDEEAYQGIDDANRGESKTIKPTTSAGGLQKSGQIEPGRSTVFLNITRPYCDSSAARVADMLLPTDDRNWAIKPTPIPDLVNAKPTPVVDAQGQQVMRDATQDEIKAEQQQADPSTQTPAPGGGPQQTPVAQSIQMIGNQAKVPLTVKDLADAAIQKAQDSAEAAQRRIDDWQVECQYHSEVRKVIEDASRMGTGVLKGPFPTNRRGIAIRKNEQTGEWGIDVEIKIGPASKRIDPWNLFPDGSCGEDIHNGSYLLEYDELTRRGLKDLRNLDGYINSEIDKCLEEGPQRNRSDVGNPKIGQTDKSDKDRFGIWYFFGEIEREDLEAANVDLTVAKDPKADSFYAIITMVNDRVIKAALNPLDSGKFPYDVMVWQRRSGHWTGIGVARQVRTPQRMLNAGTRNMMDNAGLAGGPIIGIRRKAITPADGNYSITPRKVYFLNEDSDVDDIRKALSVMEIPMVQAELMNIIQFALKMAEDVTGLPMLMQGQQGNSAPDTYGGQILVTNNASTVLRRIARTFDDRITEPHIRRYYEWLLMYGPEESEKGDFQIDARGSAALVEREIQAQEITQMLESSLNPAFGLDPKRCVAEYLRSRRFDPKKFQYTEAELEQMAKQPQPLPPAVQAAQIRAKASIDAVNARNMGDLQLAMQEAQREEQMLQNGQATPHMATAMSQVRREEIRAASQERIAATRSDAELAYAETERDMARDNAHARLVELQLKRDLAILDYTSKHNLTLEQTKAELAKTAMQEATKRQVAAVEAQAQSNENHQQRVHEQTMSAGQAEAVPA